MTHPFSPGASVSAYLRDSGGNRQELSVVQQEERVRAWCAENNLLPDLDIGALVREGLAILDSGDERKKQLLLRSFVREVRAEETDGELVGEIDLLMPGGEGKSFPI